MLRHTAPHMLRHTAPHMSRHTAPHMLRHTAPHMLRHTAPHMLRHTAPHWAAETGHCEWGAENEVCMSCCEMKKRMGHCACHVAISTLLHTVAWHEIKTLHYTIAGVLPHTAWHCATGTSGEALGWGHGMGGFINLCDSKPRISVVARCNMLQLAAICYSTLHHTEPHCNTLLGDLCDTATHCHTLLWDVLRRLQWVASQRVLQCVAGCCRVLRCGVLQCVAVCCSALQCVAVCCSVVSTEHDSCLWDSNVTLVGVLQCVPVCCSVLQCVAVWLVWVSTKLNLLFWWCASLSWVLSASRIWLISASTEGVSCQRSTEGDSCGANTASSKANRLFLVT